MKKSSVVITQDETKPVEKQILAAAIVEMSSGVQRLQKSGINFEAIVILTQHHCRAVGGKYNKTKPSVTEIRAVLESLADLQRAYTK